MSTPDRRRLRAAFDQIYGGRFARPGMEDRVMSVIGDEWERSERSRRRPLLIATAVTVALAILTAGTLVALGRVGSRPGAPAGPAPTTAPSPTLAPSPAPSGSGSQGSGTSPAPSPAGTPRCHTGDLTATIRPLSPGAGQRYAVLDLTNSSGHACWVYGYVGMQLQDAAHQPLPTGVGRLSAPPPTQVLLEPGQDAFTQLHWTVVPGPGEFQTAQCEPTPAWLEVTPPDETTQLIIPWTLGYICLQGRIDELGALAGGPGPS